MSQCGPSLILCFSGKRVPHFDVSYLKQNTSAVEQACNIGCLKDPFPFQKQEMVLGAFHTSSLQGGQQQVKHGIKGHIVLPSGKLLFL